MNVRNMKEKDIKKNKKLIEDITKLNRMRQYELADDIDEILEDLGDGSD